MSLLAAEQNVTQRLVKSSMRTQLSVMVCYRRRIDHAARRELTVAVYFVGIGVGCADKALPDDNVQPHKGCDMCEVGRGRPLVLGVQRYKHQCLGCQGEKRHVSTQSEDAIGKCAWH
jgi:hypothetical protein